MTMTGTKIKLCGLSRPRDIRAANALKPEFVGFVFAPRSRRYVQLHGAEDNGYIRRLRALTDRPVIQAFRIRSEEDVRRAADSGADHILLDSGAGTGTAFDWALLRHIKRPYFLAGGLGPGKVERAVELLHPYAVDVSSGIETEGVKDPSKMAAFVAAARKEDKR